MTNLREAAQMALMKMEYMLNNGEWYKPEEAIEALRAALANEFNPDWDQVEALQESLREHMAEIQRLRAALAQEEINAALDRDDEIERLSDLIQEQDKKLAEYEAQPEQEPVAWRVIDGEGRINYVSRHKDSAESWLQYDATRRLEPLYVAPPQREWVGLPESAFAAMTLQQVSAMKYAELLLKEKNNG